MNDLCGLRCYLCSNLLMDFVMLVCNHTICAQCLSMYQQCDQNIITVPCKCGLVTNIPKHKNRQSSSQFLQTYTSIPSVTSIRRNKTQIFDQSYFTIYQGSRQGDNEKNNRIKINEKKNLEFKQVKGNNLTNYLLNQLGNQVKFMQLRFKRYLNQINRFYNRLIVQLNKNYDSVKNILLQKCKAKIQLGQIKCLSTIQNTIQKIFRPKMQKKLIKISKQLSKFVLNNTKQAQKDQDKQNQQRSNIQLDNIYRKSLSNPKKNRHDSCKFQKMNTHHNTIKHIVTKQSKIRKKLFKKSNIIF